MPKVHPSVVELIPGALDVSDVQQKAESLAGTISSAAAAQLQSRGFTADSISMEGEPKSTIVDYAKEWGADLIVVGSSDRPRIETFFVGSVSQSVVKHSHCSVLIVKA